MLTFAQELCALPPPLVQRVILAEQSVPPALDFPPRPLSHCCFCTRSKHFVFWGCGEKWLLIHHYADRWDRLGCLYITSSQVRSITSMNVMSCLPASASLILGECWTPWNILAHQISLGISSPASSRHLRDSPVPRGALVCFGV